MSKWHHFIWIQYLHRDPIAYYEEFLPHCISSSFLLSGGGLTVRLARRISCIKTKRPDSLLTNAGQRQEVVSMAAHAFMQRNTPPLFQPHLKSRHVWKSVCFQRFATVGSHGRMGWSNVSLSTKGPMISLRSTRKRTDCISSRTVIWASSESKILMFLLQAIWIKHHDFIVIIIMHIN